LRGALIFSVPLRPAAFTAECVTVGPTRAERVQQVLGTARATLARCRADEFQFRERPAEPPGAPGRPRDRPLASRDRISPPQTAFDIQAPTWEQERAAVLEAICTGEEGRVLGLEVIRGLHQCAGAGTDQVAVSPP